MGVQNRSGPRRKAEGSKRKNLMLRWHNNQNNLRIIRIKIQRKLIVTVNVKDYLNKIFLQ